MSVFINCFFFLSCNHIIIFNDRLWTERNRFPGISFILNLISDGNLIKVTCYFVEFSLRSALLSSDYRDVLTSRLKAGFPSGR